MILRAAILLALAALAAHGQAYFLRLTVQNLRAEPNPDTLPPEAAFLASTTSGTAPLTVAFANNTLRGAWYNWDFNSDGAIDDLSFQPSYTYTTPGTYTVTLTAFNLYGSDTLTQTNYITVTTPPAPVANFSAAPTGGDAPLLVLFGNSSSYAESYQWDFDNDGDTDSTLVNPSYSYPTGTFSVKLTAIGPGGTNSLTRSNLITAVTPSGGSPDTNSLAMTLPVEVLSHLGSTTVTSRFTVSLAATLLEIVANNLNYSNKGSLSVNGAAAIPLNNGTVTLPGLNANFGGIGGASGNVRFFVPVNLPQGTNEIAWSYNRQDLFWTPGGTVDDNSMGWKVIYMAAYGAGGTNLMTTDEVDPATWTFDPALVAEGLNLWRGTNELGNRFYLQSQVSTNLSGPIWLATCADCHADDGSDLKYFNYSPFVIEERARLHGLTPTQAVKLRHYILSLTNIATAPLGRPWNPLFQPGPGMTNAATWSAGAGWDAWVDEHDELLLNNWHPGVVAVTNGVPGWNAAAISPSNLPPHRYINPRTAPVSLQLQDWNRWLPDVHPMDAYTTGSASNAVQSLLATYATAKGYATASNWPTLKTILPSQFMADSDTLRLASGWTQWSTNLNNNRKLYAMAQWIAVKMWHMHSPGKMETVGASYYGPRAEPLSYLSDSFFFNHLSADLRQFEGNHTGLGQGGYNDNNVSRGAWYHNMALLSNGHRRAESASSYPWIGIAAGSPWDVGYIYGFVKNLAETSGYTTYPMMYTYIQFFNQWFDTGVGPERAFSMNSAGAFQLSGGWNAVETAITPLGYYYPFPPGNGFIGDIPTNIVAALNDAAVNAWLFKTTNYAKANFQSGAPPLDLRGSFLPPSTTPTNLRQTAADDSYRMLSSSAWGLDTWGLTAATRNRWLDWCVAMWPEYTATWESLRP